MRYRTGLIAAVLMLSAGNAPAQTGDPDRLRSILTLTRLPRATQEARSLGVPDTELRSIFDRIRDRTVPAVVVTEVIESGNESMREHGPIDNFGAFVQSKLDQGLRGRELAAAIRAEHAARGKGRGHLKDGGQDHGSGAPGHSASAPGERGKPAGTPADRGKSGEKGKGDPKDDDDNRSNPGRGKGGPR